MRADRLLSIILLLQRQGKMTTQALADELDVSRRTILRDLDALSTANVPVYKLLGGKVRDKVRVFASVVGETPEARGESARAAVAQGYTSLRALPFFNGWEAQTPSKYIGDVVKRKIEETEQECITPETDRLSADIATETDVSFSPPKPAIG